MRVLLLTHAFNSLAQRLYVDLARRGHELSVELDIGDAVTQEAVALFDPDVVVAPFLKRAIPESVWRRRVCLIVHPGIVGDRGPSSLDWAILGGEREWGVTVLQANGVMDGGDVWAWRTFPMRAASKGSLYRHEVTEAASQAVIEALDKLAAGLTPCPPERCAVSRRGVARACVRQADRYIDWKADPTDAVLRKIRASDGHPGVLDRIAGSEYLLCGAHPEARLRGLRPGELIARRHGAVCRTTVDGAVWISQLRRSGTEPAAKLPAVLALGEAAARLPEASLPVLPRRDPSTWQDIWYEEADGVGWLGFEFANGAMSTEQCERLREAFLAAARRDTRVIVLAGGADFWSNGIHLNVIEAAASPADESWRNINAMDDLCLAILGCTTHLTIAALRGNAGAGGVFLALAADRVVVRDGVILNAHYKGMGNLYDSEYWTYLLPRRVGWESAREITTRRLPMGAADAQRLGLVDACLDATPAGFVAKVGEIARGLAAPAVYPERIQEKRNARMADERSKPLSAYRAEELDRMRLNFYGFDPSYHVARYHFVHKVPHAWTPLHLAVHRQGAWKRRASA
ncbi:MAG TPA: hydrogenase maturation protein [Usitatibacter sp.]|nr:hydrogenase maturation protein [Usitatibacter sp.]